MVRLDPLDEVVAEMHLRGGAALSGLALALRLVGLGCGAESFGVLLAAVFPDKHVGTVAAALPRAAFLVASELTRLSRFRELGHHLTPFSAVIFGRESDRPLGLLLLGSRPHRTAAEQPLVKLGATGDQRGAVMVDGDALRRDKGINAGAWSVDVGGDPLGTA